MKQFAKNVFLLIAAMLVVAGVMSLMYFGAETIKKNISKPDKPVYVETLAPLESLCLTHDNSATYGRVDSSLLLQADSIGFEYYSLPLFDGERKSGSESQHSFVKANEISNDMIFYTDIRRTETATSYFYRACVFVNGIKITGGWQSFSTNGDPDLQTE